MCKGVGGVFFEDLCFAFLVGFTMRPARDFAAGLIWGLELGRVMIAGVFSSVSLSSLSSAGKP